MARLKQTGLTQNEMAKMYKHATANLPAAVGASPSLGFAMAIKAAMLFVVLSVDKYAWYERMTD